MKIGTVFPQTEIGADAVGVRDYAQAVEDMGFTHIAIFDHVIGASPENRDFAMVYTVDSMFHEPLVVYGYLAAIARKIELVTSVIILPQRQTVLVAKQAAEVDVLTNGRFRLGVGLGWNPIEYQALNENFHNRGARIEEQVEVMRKLWTEPIVDFRGKWHTIDRAGLNPLPIQRPIPIWFGGISERALRRVARIADGWMPNGSPAEGWPALVARVRGYVRDAGRDVDRFGLEARLDIANKTPDQWRAVADEWRDLGANYLDINTMGCGLRGPRAHVDQLRQVKTELGV